MSASQNPYTAPRSHVHRAASEPQPQYFKSWLIFAIVAGLGGFLVGLVAGGIIGAALGVAGVPLSTIKAISALVGFVLGLPISFFAFKWSVNRYLLSLFLTV